MKYRAVAPESSTTPTSSKSSKPTSSSKDSEPKKDGGSSKSGKSLRDPNAGPESTTETAEAASEDGDEVRRELPAVRASPTSSASTYPVDECISGAACVTE
eukprot:207858_1